MHDELLDVVNENDEVIGQKMRSEIYANGLHFRTINGFIKNSQGKLWIPRRTSDQWIFPDGLDLSVAGHVKAGESYAETFKRKVKKELDLEAENLVVKELGKIGPAQGLSSFSIVYEISLDTVPNFNTTEFSEYFWLTPAELLAKIAAGDQAKSDLPKIISYFYTA